MTDKCVCCLGTSFSFAAKAECGEYLRCNSCGSLFQKDALQGPQHLREKFNQEQSKFYSENSVMLSNSFAALQKAATVLRLSIVRQHLTHGRLFEVGPGDGSVMRYLFDHGYAVEGIEHSAVLSREITSRTGLEVKNGDFDALEVDKVYDAYMSFHVIEHVPDIVGHLRKAATITRPGGFAFIATPHAQSLEHKILGGAAPNFSSAHLQLFSQDGLRKALDQAGWDVIDIRTPEYAVSWLRFATAIRRKRKGVAASVARGAYSMGLSDRWLIAIKAFSIVTRPLRKIQELSQLGNELFVVARRRKT